MSHSLASYPVMKCKLWGFDMQVLLRLFWPESSQSCSPLRTHRLGTSWEAMLRGWLCLPARYVTMASWQWRNGDFEKNVPEKFHKTMTFFNQKPKKPFLNKILSSSRRFNVFGGKLTEVREYMSRPWKPQIMIQLRRYVALTPIKLL